MLNISQPNSDAEPGHHGLRVTKTAVNDGFFGKIRLPRQKLYHDLSAQGNSAQGEEVSATMLLDIVHELVCGPLGGDIGRLICLAMAIQRGQDHMVVLGQDTGLPQVVPPSVSTAVDQHDVGARILSEFMKGHIGSPPEWVKQDAWVIILQVCAKFHTRAERHPGRIKARLPPSEIPRAGALLISASSDPVLAAGLRSSL